ncbi:MAG: MFS transporter [Desulfovibrio sp.]|nr:MFS transporter [Desulfovibrio sp.]
MNAVPLPRSKMTRARWALLASLYMTQYVGQGFLLISLPVIMRGHGAPLEQLGLVYLLGIFWIVKFLWAPLVDSVSFGVHGHYRAWLLLTQGGMLAVLPLIGQCRLPDQFYLIIALGLLHSLFSATQDIASDALAYTLLLPSERALGSSVQTAGGLLGNIIGGGLVLMAYPYVGWRGCSWLLAGTVALCFIQLLVFSEPAHTSLIRLSGGMKRIVTFWKEEGHACWLLLLACYALGIGMVWGIIPPMLADCGWSVGRIGFTVNIAGSLVGMAGAVLSGRLVKSLGRKRMLWTTSACVISSLCVMAVSSSVEIGSLPLQILILSYFAGMSPAMVLLPTLMLDHASPESPATDYTVQFCALTAIQYISGGLSIVVAGSVGYTNILIAGIAAEFFALLLVSRFVLPRGAGGEDAASPYGTR